MYVVDPVERDARVVVSRTGDDDVRYRDVWVVVDGERSRDLCFGHHMVLKLAPGKHTIHASNGLWRTRPMEFEVAAGETKTFIVGNTMGALLGTLLMIGVVPPRVFLRLA